MLFVYANQPHARKHGPSGFTAYATFKPWLRDEFHFRCVYCLERERWDRSGYAAFGVDHVKPKSVPEYKALICDYENLVYACNRCNSLKRNVLLLDPCVDTFADHLRMDDEGELHGYTLAGKRLIKALGLNNDVPRAGRQRLLRILLLCQSDPDHPKLRALYLDFFGYPDDLPNLDVLRPESNTRPTGTKDC